MEETLKLVASIILAALLYALGYFQGRMKTLHFLLSLFEEINEETKKRKDEKRDTRENQEV